MKIRKVTNCSVCGPAAREQEETIKTVQDRQKAVDHTYDEDYYEEEDYDYEYEEEPDPNGLEVPFENDNRRKCRCFSPI